MKKMKDILKRKVSVGLVAVMLVSQTPVTAFAAEMPEFKKEQLKTENLISEPTEDEPAEAEEILLEDVAGTLSAQEVSSDENPEPGEDTESEVVENEESAGEDEYTEVSTWSDLQAKLSAGGNVKLTSDVTAGEGDSALDVPSGQTVTLDLNGYTIDRGLAGSTAVENGNVITVLGNLTISDNSAAQTGKITGGNNTGNGGGVCVYNDGTFTINGGTITNCTAYSDGGGVYVDVGGTFRVSGAPVISGNMTVDSANNVALGYRTTITVFNELTSGAKIYVHAGNKDPVATVGEAYTLKASDMDAFHSDGDGSLVAALDSDGNVKFFTPWGALQAKLTNASEVEGNPTQIKLSGDLTADTRDNALWIPEGTYVTLDLNGYTIDRGLTSQANNGNVITVEGHLTISDNSTAHTGTITGGNNTGNGGGVYVRESGEFTMKGGTISGCNVTGNNSKGGGVCVDSGKFTMEGGAITGCNASENGGGVYVGNNGKFTISGGTITGCNASEYGGGVYVDNNGKFTMSGGTITGCNASENGGGVYVGNNGEFTMSGGTITGCKAGWGGGVFVYEGKFTMEDGIISNCNTDNGGYGGGVYVGNNGEFTMSGGTITSCNASLNGGGVCVNSNGTFTMEGGTISGCIVNGLGCKGGGVYVEDGTFTMSGAPLIKDNSANNSANNVALNYGTIITVIGALTTGAEIWVNADKGVAFAKKEGSYSITDTDLTKFHSEKDSSLVAAEDSDGVKFFTPWGALQAKFNNASTVEGSPTQIKLTGNVTASGNETALVIPEDRYVTLDLSGHTIDRGLAGQPVGNNGNVITVSGNLTLTDSSSAHTGTITGGNNEQASGGGVNVKGGAFTMDGGTISGCNAALGGGVNVDSGTFTMTGGTITGCNAYDSGGGVCVNGSFTMNGGTFTMTGGTITDCNATSHGGRGGGVHVEGGGKFTMEGGTIDRCNTAAAGGGVYNHGTFNMSDGTITNCSANNSGGGVYIEDRGTFKVSGTPVISDNMKGSTSANNVELGGKTISVNGALTSGAEIHVNAGKGDVVATGENYTLQASDADAFRSDRPSSLTAALDSDGTVKFFTPWGALQAKFNNASTVAGSPTQITLTGDVTAGEGDTALVIPAGKYVTLDLSGNTIDRGLANKSAKDNGNVITVKGTLILKDSSSAHTGTITGGNTTGNGGGVFVNEGGTFTMNGGTITGCTVAGHYNTYGGGVFNYGTFAMSGGTITNCSAKQGGGVYVEGDGSVERGKFTMNGGTINGCNATSDGGGVYVGGGNGTFTMTDGTITDCNATSDGGGVYVEGGNKFTMENGTITGCKANNSGGGVYVHGDSFTMDGGTITGCSATNGGGVYVLKDMFTMSGGTISGCTATNHGGGVFVGMLGTFTMSGAPVIKDNSANNVALNDGTIITVTGALEPAAEIHINAGKGTTVAEKGDPRTASLTETEAGYFKSDVSSDLLGRLNDAGQVVLKAPLPALTGAADLTYNGTEQTPALTFFGDPAPALTEGTDYTVSYKKVDGSTGTALIGAPKDAGDYKAVATGKGSYAGTSEAEFTIARKEVTVSSGILAEDKTYDGTTAAALDTTGAVFDGIYTGDSLTVSGTGTFDNASAGSGKTVTISSVTLGGTSSGNYVLASGGNQSETTATINKKKLTITDVTAADKEYDGNTTATTDTSKATVTGLVDGETVAFTVSGNFADANKGENKTVTLSGWTLTSGGNNYEIDADKSQKTTTAGITVMQVYITGITAENKEYDGNKTATVSGAAVLKKVKDDNIISDLSVSNITAEFADKNAGNNKAVSITGGTLDSENYTLIPGETTGLTANITPKQVIITGLSAKDKVYDTTTAATTIGTAVIDGKIGSDDVTVAPGTAAFDNANAGTGKTVTFSGYSLTGQDVGNYSLSAQPASVTADITPKSINNATVTLGTASFIYNGEERSVSVTDVKLGDKSLDSSDYEVSGSLTGTNVDTYTVTVTGVGNYKDTASADWAIEQKEVGLTWSTDPLTFNGSAQAPTATATGTVNSDEIGVTVSGAQVNAGTGYTATASGLTGEKAGNYKLPEAKTTNFSIGKAAAQTITDVAASQVYTLTGVSASVAGKMPDNAGTLTYNKAGDATKTGSVTVTSFAVDESGTVTATLSGGAAGDTVTLPVIISSTNYADSAVNVMITLTPKEDAELGITGAPTSKTYGDADFTLTGSVKKEGIGTGSWTWTTSDATVFRITSNGAAATVKILKAGSATITARYESDTTVDTKTTDTITVNTKTLTIGAKDQSIYVGGTVPTLSGTDFYTVTGLVGTDELTAQPTLAYQKDGSAATPDGNTAGTYDIVPSGAAASENYTISYTNGTLTIREKGTQTISAENVTVTYGDTDKSVSANVTEPATGGGAISYAVKDGSADYIDVDASTGALTIRKVPTDGKAYVVVTAAETAAYTQATKEVTVTINKADAVPATVSANNCKYDGTEKQLVTVDDSTLVGGTMQYALGTDDKTVPSDGWGETIPAATDASTYYVWYMVKGDENHSDTTPECMEVTIEKADMTVGVEGYDDIYDGTAHGITVNVTKPADNYTISYGTKEGTYDLTTAPTYTHASDETHTVYFKVSANGYNDHTGSASVKISKRPVTVTADDKSTTYGTETEPLTYTVSGNIIAGDDLIIQLKTEASASKPVGEYPITVSYDTTKTDYAVTTVQGKYTINAADITVTASGYSGTYDGAAHGITVETSGDDTVTVYYSTETELNDENYQTAGSTDNPTRTDAGTTTVYYYVSSQNYVPTSVYGNKDIVITKAEVGTPEVSMSGYTYGGDVPAPSIGDFPGGGAVTYFYNTVDSIDGGTEWKDVTATTLNAGDYFMYAVIAESDNYNAYTTATTSFTVDKADQSPDSIIPPVGKTGIVYNGAEQELVEAGSAAEGTMLYVLGSDAATEPISGWDEAIPAAIEPGTYYVWYMVKGDENHNDTDPKSVKAVINKIEVMSIGLRAVTGTAMEPGTSQQLEVTTVPSGVPARHFTWTSSKPDTVSVNSIGLVTAGSVLGEAEITAKAHNGVQASITIKVVEEKIEVDSVEIDQTSVKGNPKPGDSFRLTAVIKPANATDKTVTWESSNTEVAEIGATGIVTVRKPGETRVTVWAAKGTVSDNIILKVDNVPVTGITISTTGGDDYLVAGRTARLTATVTPADATEQGVIWSSSDQEIASVNEYGEVTANKEGRVTITAASKNNNEISATADFIVFSGDDSLYVEFAFGSDYAYTGSAITPMVNVYYKGELLTRDTDYTVSYKNNKNANDASNVKKAPTVKVTGKTVAATTEAVFKILPADIGDEDLVTAQEVTVASGKKAAPELYFGGTKLAGKDFTNPYAKDKFYNSRPITVYGKGNFTGEREIWINVKTAQEVKNQPKIKVKSFTPVKRYYNGQPQLIDKSEIMVVNSADKSNTPLTIDQDFYIAYPEDVTSVGTVKIAVVGMGDYTGVVKKSYKIEAARDDDVAEEGLDVSFLYSEGEYGVDGVKYDTFTYRPGGVQPYVKVDVTLKSGEVETLISGRDYKVTYKDNKKAAKANKDKLSTATITFKGNYKSLKKVEKKFYIKQADLGAASVYTKDKVVTKGNVKYPLQAPVVDIGGVTVRKSEYTVTYTDADGNPLDNKSKLNLQNSGDSAEVKVVIAAKKDKKSGAETGNYTGTNESGSYVITLADASKDLSKAKVIIQKKGDPNNKAVRKFDFTGKPIVIGDEPNEGYELYVYIGKNANDPNKVVLEEGTDYTVEYSNNVKAGKATIILNAVDGSDKCFGSRTHTFNIVKGIMSWIKR